METIEPIIDSDSHVGEPATLWTDRVGPKRAEEVFHVRYNDERARQEWFIGDEFVSLAPSGANVGWREPPPAAPPTFEDAHPAVFDVHERLALMDSVGIAAQVLFPTVAGLGSDAFLKITDNGLKLECVRAYNDYVADWISPAPDRFVATCTVPFWDREAAVAEIDRALSIGHKAILMCGKPNVYWGQAGIADSMWNPIWEIASDRGVPVAFHVGGADPNNTWAARGSDQMPKRTRFTANVVANFFGPAQTISEVIFGGVLEKFPKLNIALVETGIGWLPFFLECMDYNFIENNVRERSPELKLLPSEYFRRQMWASFWFEKSGPQRLLEVLGDDHVMFETDFPHPTSLWPPSQIRARIETAMEGANPTTRRRVMWQNAADLYGVKVAGQQQDPVTGQ